MEADQGLKYQKHYWLIINDIKIGNIWLIVLLISEKLALLDQYYVEFRV